MREQGTTKRWVKCVHWMQHPHTSEDYIRWAWRHFKVRGWLLREVGTEICLSDVGGRECAGSWSRGEKQQQGHVSWSQRMLDSHRHSLASSYPGCAQVLSSPMSDSGKECGFWEWVDRWQPSLMLYYSNCLICCHSLCTLTVCSSIHDLHWSFPNVE